jgi:hypothetical protein
MDDRRRTPSDVNSSYYLWNGEPKNAGILNYIHNITDVIYFIKVFPATLYIRSCSNSGSSCICVLGVSMWHLLSLNRVWNCSEGVENRVIMIEKMQLPE